MLASRADVYQVDNDGRGRCAGWEAMAHVDHDLVAVRLHCACGAVGQGRWTDVDRTVEVTEASNLPAGWVCFPPGDHAGEGWLILCPGCVAEREAQGRDLRGR